MTPEHPIKSELESLLKPKPVAPPVAVRRKRTLGDIYTALEAQRVFHPEMPSVPKPPSASPANLSGKGTAAALDSSGAWGGPGETGEK